MHPAEARSAAATFDATRRVGAAAARNPQPDPETTTTDDEEEYFVIEHLLSLSDAAGIPRGIHSWQRAVNEYQHRTHRKREEDHMLFLQHKRRRIAESAVGGSSAAAAAASSSSTTPIPSKVAPETHYELKWFINNGAEVERDNLVCAICLDAVCSAMSPACGHCICKACVGHMPVEDGMIVCPTCKRSGFYTPNGFADRMVLRMQARCEFCSEWKGCLSDLLIHRPACPKNTTQCARCTAHIQVSAAAVHETSECPKRQIRCLACNAFFIADAVDAHINACPSARVPCRVCARTMIRAILYQHTCKCRWCGADERSDRIDAHKLIKCPEGVYCTTGCGTRVPRADVAAHAALHRDGERVERMCPYREMGCTAAPFAERDDVGRHMLADVDAHTRLVVAFLEKHWPPVVDGAMKKARGDVPAAPHPDIPANMRDAITAHAWRALSIITADATIHDTPEGVPYTYIVEQLKKHKEDWVKLDMTQADLALALDDLKQGGYICTTIDDSHYKGTASLCILRGSPIPVDSLSRISSYTRRILDAITVDIRSRDDSDGMTEEHIIKQIESSMTPREWLVYPIVMEEFRVALHELEMAGYIHTPIDDHHYKIRDARSRPAAPAHRDALTPFQHSVLLIVQKARTTGCFNADIGVSVGYIHGMTHGSGSPSEVRAALAELQNEGHVYTTVDDDHYQCTTWAQPQSPPDARSKPSVPIGDLTDIQRRVLIILLEQARAAAPEDDDDVGVTASYCQGRLTDVWDTWRIRNVLRELCTLGRVYCTTTDGEEDRFRVVVSQPLQHIVDPPRPTRLGLTPIQRAIWDVIERFDPTAEAGIPYYLIEETLKRIYPVRDIKPALDEMCAKGFVHGTLNHFKTTFTRAPPVIAKDNRLFVLEIIAQGHQAGPPLTGRNVGVAVGYIEQQLRGRLTLADITTAVLELVTRGFVRATINTDHYELTPSPWRAARASDARPPAVTRLIWDVLEKDDDDEDDITGTSYDLIVREIAGLYPEKDIKKALDEMSTDGFIYTTIDEHHYKLTARTPDEHRRIVLEVIVKSTRLVSPGVGVTVAYIATWLKGRLTDVQIQAALVDLMEAKSVCTTIDSHHFRAIEDPRPGPASSAPRAVDVSTSQQVVFDIIEEGPSIYVGQDGVTVEYIIEKLKGKLTPTEILKAITDLKEKASIYTTVDDDRLHVTPDL